MVKLIVLDFDGVLTDNRVWVSGTGEESVACNRSDGLGISLVKEKGIHVCVLSSETHIVVMKRCQKLKIPCYYGISDKLFKLKIISDRFAVDFEDIAYIGNDVNDIECMKAVGCSIAVADAHPDVLSIADMVLTKCGGKGAVREYCDMVLKDEQNIYYC